MDTRVKDFFRQPSDDPHGNFHQVIALHEAPDFDWKTIHPMVKDLPKGWLELARLSPKDRVEFLRDFWMNKLPYRCGFSEFLLKFFDSIEDVGVYIVKKNSHDPFETCLVYSVKGDKSFYRGGPPALEEDILLLQKKFGDFSFPGDYVAFLQIHDGFWKTTDCTGICRLKNLKKLNETFQQLIGESLLTSEGKEVNPKSLVAFYESFGMPFFQCFWSDWYPEEEVGNVYFSGESKTLLYREGVGPEAMAFPTFLDWLMFYLEQIE